ncbi:hypothetical protein G4B88_027691 [Cannabis sativa]|uniref:Uncharacterized protein n=1 Tax=Cannabis sativa TaxID=3483 RepID=A0A7J6ERX6_CANSA|nr:hypothetical protein G4B88_027691 [Cannabis sativa]
MDWTLNLITIRLRPLSLISFLFEAVDDDGDADDRRRRHLLPYSLTTKVISSLSCRRHLHQRRKRHSSSLPNEDTSSPSLTAATQVRFMLDLCSNLATATYLPRLLSAIHHRLSQMSTPMLPSSHFLPSNRKLLIDFESIVES